MTLWEYEALLADNESRYAATDDAGVAPPSKDVVKARLAALAADPRFTK